MTSPTRFLDRARGCVVASVIDNATLSSEAILVFAETGMISRGLTPSSF